jgi:predicted O-linked N-acetylglucosamine transferase (SPINDLY family)
MAGAGWRHMPGAPSEAVAAQVVHDRIDILIDAMGWTELQRMAVFEPRSAPVQMTWLGYPNTTGLPSMDYRILDEITDPPGSEALCTEKLLRLPGCFVCYQPEADAPEPQMTKALSDPASGEPITFGSFNRLSKVRPATARTWGAILKAVPGSRLMLKSSLVSEDVKAEYLREFAGAGVGPERLVWSSYVFGPKAHLSMYHQVDIALDSFPYNGTTTTCEAAWMGVPVVTLTGRTHRERVGTSLLTALGLTELIAPTREKFIEIAADLAKDRSRLAEYHRSLRGRMSSSGLCDAKGFARKLEAALRGAWRARCVSP